LILICVSPISFAACGATNPSLENTSQPSPTLSISREVPNVGFCDIERDPGRYAGKLARTRAVLAVGLETQHIYDPSCLDKNTLLWFEADNLEVSRALDEGFEAHRGGRRATRVNAMLVGRIDGPSAEGFGHLNGFEYQFAIMAVGQVSAVPPEVVWP
jgi:hypothetical protein